MVLKSFIKEGFFGTLEGPGFDAPCLFGRGGAADRKTEGDGASPRGSYAMRSCYYRPDRRHAPKTGLPVIPITKGLGWCDDPGHVLYNRPVRLPFAASHENMWRADAAYDLVVVLSHNLDRPVPGAGSAVFFHLFPHEGARTATEGCVAVSAGTMERALAGARIGTPFLIDPV